MAFILHKKDGQNVVALQLIAICSWPGCEQKSSGWPDPNHYCCKFFVQCFLFGIHEFSKTMPLLVRSLEFKSGGLEVLACQFKYLSVLLNISLNSGEAINQNLDQGHRKREGQGG